MAEPLVRYETAGCGVARIAAPAPLSGIERPRLGGR